MPNQNLQIRYLSLVIAFLLSIGQSCHSKRTRSADNPNRATDLTDAGSAASSNARTLVEGRQGDIEDSGTNTDDRSDDRYGLSAEGSIPPDRIVPPADATPEVLRRYIDEPTDWEQLPSLDPGTCGYAMNIEQSIGDEHDVIEREVRFFDEAGRILAQQNKIVNPSMVSMVALPREGQFDSPVWPIIPETKLEVKYDTEGRPVTIWYKDKGVYDELRDKLINAVLVSTGYNSDGSAVSKLVYDDLTVSPDAGSCFYYLFDSRLRFVEGLENFSCNEIAHMRLEMRYNEDGKPERFLVENVFYNTGLSEIVWDYSDDGRRVVASWQSVATEPWIGTFNFDNADRLLSVSVDFADDGVIDESTEYSYNEDGKMTRTATDLNRDGADDLLRLDTYNDDGLLVTRELHNLLPSTYDSQIDFSDFRYVVSGTNRTTTFTYDNDGKLLESATEGYFIREEFRTVHESFRYDDRGRLVEQVVTTNTYQEDDSGGQELLYTSTTKCTFEFPCASSFFERSEVHHCAPHFPILRYLFPYDTAGETAFHSNRKPEQRSSYYLYYIVSEYDLLGIPWY